MGIRSPIPVREALIDTTEAPEKARYRATSNCEAPDAAFQVELVRNLEKLTGIKLG